MLILRKQIFFWFIVENICERKKKQEFGKKIIFMKKKEMNVDRTMILSFGKCWEFDYVRD